MLNSLYLHRARFRISQMALARQCGIPFYRFWKIENGYHEPNARDRAALAAYFGVPESDIFPETSTPPTPPADADDAAHP